VAVAGNKPLTRPRHAGDSRTHHIIGTESKSA